MNLRGLKWFAIVLPAFFLILLELVRQFYLESPAASWTGRLIPITIMVVGVFVFSHLVFGLLARMQQEILPWNASWMWCRSSSGRSAFWTRIIRNLWRWPAVRT